LYTAVKKSSKDRLKSLPAVDALLAVPGIVPLIEEHGRQVVVAAVRRVLERFRDEFLSGGDEKAPSAKSVIAQAAAALRAEFRPRLRRAVNATGVILHTGLGRAVMPGAAGEALSTMTGCCNVQMDLLTGERIRREECVRDLARDLTGAEDVVLVNNNAGATMLILKALAEGKETIVSRGELIEIGGSFRLPEIMRVSGAVLREVGSTNKTHLRDYERAIGPDTGLILKVHKSNYQIVGFSGEVGIADIAKVGKKHGIPVVDDLGCGALVDLEQFGMKHEMTARESLAAGADVALFSTDKLIGGPQGGMIVGRSDLLARIRKNPVYRALRVCKMTLAALEATLRLFKSPELLSRTHPVYMMIAKRAEEMEQQARKVSDGIAAIQPDWDVCVVEDASFLGGGSLPGSKLPSCAVRVRSKSRSAEQISGQFRSAPVPVVPRIREDCVLLDMRTVFPSEVDDVIAAAKADR
jgi:L-seryl-tRNA(Ser) seleniumtransferase